MNGISQYHLIPVDSGRFYYFFLQFFTNSIDSDEIALILSRSRPIPIRIGRFVGPWYWRLFMFLWDYETLFRK